MLPLQLVWWLSLSLAVSAMLCFVILVVRRFVAEGQAIKESLVRQKVQELLFCYMDSETESIEEEMALLTALGPLERRLLRQTSVKLSKLVQGHERERIALLLEHIGFKDLCIEECQEGELRNRLAAVEALQLFKDSEVQNTLIDLLDDKEEDIRIVAADSLSAIGALPKPNILVAKLSTDSILQSRDLRTLFREIARHDPSYLSRIAKFTGISRYMKIAIADALAQSSDFRVIHDLIAYAQNPDLDIRASAIRSLGTLRHPQAENLLNQSIDDEQWQVRAVSAQAIGLIGLEHLALKLSPLLDDSSWWVRFRSAEALAQLGPIGIQELRSRANRSSTENNNSGGRIAALLLSEVVHA
ncbi:MAG: HEAT repeat domain-containing protein [Pseudohongiellaceae bacterium]|nr:HEAT repeat domain-containing protein [Pseudohongiellaceae bacterium]